MNQFQKLQIALDAYFEASNNAKLKGLFVQIVARQFGEKIAKKDKARDGWLTARLTEVTGVKPSGLSETFKKYRVATVQTIEVAYGLYFLAKVDDDYKIVVPEIERVLFGEIDGNPRTMEDVIGLKLRKVLPGSEIDRIPSMEPDTRLFDYANSDNTRKLLTNLQTVNPFESGELSVFEALHWRAKLTRLYGRDEEFKCIQDFVSSTTAETPRFVIISGGGGSGKTRLASELAESISSDLGWKSGFLPRSYKQGEKIDVGHVGSCIFVDYPEERTDLTCDLIRRLSENEDRKIPICLVLVTRETADDWFERLQLTHLNNCLEISLTENQPFTTKLCERLCSKALQRLRELGMDFLPPRREAIENWLAQSSSHRLPLFSIAACVHAALEPDLGFSLSSGDTLVALAKIERTRVRSYSSRNCGNRKTLEKLLALTALTANGFDKVEIAALGDQGLSLTLKGAALFEGVQETPYWRHRTAQANGILPKLEPDRFAVAFLFLVFLSDETLPSLPLWIAAAIRTCGTDFVNVLARVCSDVSFLEVNASSRLEALAVKSLSMEPELAKTLEDVIHERTPTFAMDFVAELARQLLAKSNMLEPRAGLAIALANRLSELGEPHQALVVAKDAVSDYEQLCNELTSSEMKSNFAMALNNLGNRYADLGDYQSAMQENKRSVEIYEELVEAGNEQVLADLGNAMHNFATALADLGELEEALKVAHSSHGIRLKLGQFEQEKHLLDLASSKNSIANVLADLGRHGEAIEYTEEALQIYREISKETPELFEQELVDSLLNMSIRHGDLGNAIEALDFAEEAAVRFKRLSEIRPRAFLGDYARALNNLALRQDAVEEQNLAYETAVNAVKIYQHFSSDQEEATVVDQALALNTLGNISIDLGRDCEGKRCLEKAVELLGNIAARSAGRYLPDYAMALNNLANALSELDELESAERNIVSAISIYKQLNQSYSDQFLSEMMMALNNYCDVLIHLENFQKAMPALEWLVDVAARVCKDDQQDYGHPLLLALQKLAAVQKIHNHDAAINSFRKVLEIMSELDQADIDREEMEIFLRDYVDFCESFAVETDHMLIQKCKSMLNNQ